MADPPQPVAISAAFPAPPPFYKAFTTQNLQQLEQTLETKVQPSSSYPLPQSSPIPKLTSLPLELRTLLPPPIPSNGQYRSFGIVHTDPNPSSSEKTPTPTPARLRSLTHDLLLTFLALTHTLATDPGAYGPLWDQLHAVFQEVHKVINGYRPHQARETLILMMEEQLETVRGETRSVRESVERARGVMEVLGKQDQDEDRMADGTGAQGNRRNNREERKTKRIWEVLEREVGSV